RERVAAQLPARPELPRTRGDPRDYRNPAPGGRNPASPGRHEMAATLRGAAPRGGTMTAILSAVGGTRTYTGGSEPVHSLRGIDMDVMPGEFVAVMGASGSGKST